MKIDKFITYIKNLFRNIKFLMKYSLEEHERDQMFEVLNRVEDIYHYEIMDPHRKADVWFPNVLDYEGTIKILLEQPKSFCRFGDGEINLMEGRSISFQKYDARLAEGMRQILRENNPDLYVGINYNYFHSSSEMSDYVRRFYLIDVKPHRDFLIRNCNRERDFYIAAAFNQMYTAFDEMNIDAYYHQILSMFKDRKLVVFLGENVMKKLEYNIFDVAESVEYVYGPSSDAFEQFDDLLQQAQSYPKDYTLCFILGPTSKVLVSELSKKGYIAWDIGHMAKDYDAYRKKVDKTTGFIQEFYAPD